MLQHFLHEGEGRDFRTLERVNVFFFFFLISSQKDLVSLQNFIALSKKGGPELELASRYWKIYFFSTMIPNSPPPSVQKRLQIRDTERWKMAAYLLLLITGDFCPKAS